MAAYYNEFDPKAAAWLRQLIAFGVIPEGEVDDRSILDVRPDELRGFTQCHFFAGVGGWPFALRLAGWPDDRPVWTGSPPCQPFSPAGKGLSKNDPRHLAPHFARLVGAVRPPVLYGEQVASAEVFGPAAKGNRPGFEGQPPWAWVDDLFNRLEGAHYACGASDIPSAGVGAFHIRQRTFFGAVYLGPSGGVVNADHTRREGDGLSPLWGGGDRAGPDLRLAGSGSIGGVVHGFGAGLEGRGERPSSPRGWNAADGSVAAAGVALGLADDHGDGRSEGRGSLAQAGDDGSVGDRSAGGLADLSGRGRGEFGDAAQPGRGGYADGGEQPERMADRDGKGSLPGAFGSLHRGKEGARPWDAEPERHGDAVGLADAEHPKWGEKRFDREDGRNRAYGGWSEAYGEFGTRGEILGRPDSSDSPWGSPDWIFCRDGKWRPTESSLLGVADGVPADLVRSGAFVPASRPLAPKAQKGTGYDPARRVMRLKGYGNAINPYAAKVFILAFERVRGAMQWT